MVQNKNKASFLIQSLANTTFKQFFRWRNQLNFLDNKLIKFSFKKTFKVLKYIQSKITKKWQNKKLDFILKYFSRLKIFSKMLQNKTILVIEICNDILYNESITQIKVILFNSLIK